MIEAENLRLAFWTASRGKRCRDDQRAYEANLGAELEKMRDGLIDGTYPVGRYERFTVYEPKERIICAAAFSESIREKGIPDDSLLDRETGNHLTDAGMDLLTDWVLEMFR